MEAGSIQHRVVTAFLSLSKGGCQNAPGRAAVLLSSRHPLRARVSMTQTDSPQQCWGQQPSSLEREAWPCCLLTDPEVQVIGTSALGRFDAPTAYYGTGSI